MRLSVLALGILAASLAPAQTTTARMEGTVRDRTGAVLPKVEVAIRNVDTNITRTAPSNDVGDYVVTNLPVGRYEVSAGYPGFKRYVQGPIQLEKARSGFDLRQRFTATFIWQVPVRVRNPWLAGVAAGWQVSGAFTARTGFPLTATTGDTSNAGTGTARPNLVGDAIIDPAERTLDRWFDKTAFAAPSPYTFGTAGRNILDGPGSQALNTSISKFFRVAEGKRLQFRAEMFNATNHPNFGLPNAAFGNTAFGTIRGASAPRQVQFALKFLF